MELGLLILRTLLGLVLLAHATQKLSHRLGGTGRAGSASIFSALGHQPAHVMVVVAAASEATAGTLLILGLLTPLAAAIAAGTLLVAGASATAVAGTVWTSRGGGEYPFVLAVIALSLGYLGAGRWSLDHVLSVPLTSTDSTVLLGSSIAVAALLASLPPMFAAHRVRRTTTPSLSDTP